MTREKAQVLRMVRAFRVFRLFRRLESLGQIIRAINQPLPAVGNALILVLIFTAIYAIMVCLSLKSKFAIVLSVTISKACRWGSCSGLRWYCCNKICIHAYAPTQKHARAGHLVVSKSKTGQVWSILHINVHNVVCHDIR